MSQDEENIIISVLQKNLNKLFAKRLINKEEIRRIKEKIRNKLNNPQFSIKTSRLAEILILDLINIKRIQNQGDLDKIIQKSGFLNKYCIIKDFKILNEKTIRDIEIDPDVLEIIDTKSIKKSHEKLKKTQILQDIVKEETDKQIEEERKILELYQSIIDEGLDRPEEEILLEIEDQKEFPYLEKDFEWFKDLELKTDPFPSREGLELIDQSLYDAVVTQTRLFKKYMNILNSNPNALLNKSIIIYGEWGCGKTTFFDYFDYKCLQKNLFPIQVLLNAEGSLQKLKDAFRNEIFRKMADYVTQISLDDPRSYLQKRDDDEINLLFEILREKYNQKGFLIFLDGLHKSQDEIDIPLKFLNELQNILGIFKRRGNLIGIFIAGSNDWKQNISYSSIFSGSIYQGEKMTGINENQAHDMLSKRLSAFSENPEKEFIDFRDIQRLLNTIRKTRATEIPFRILIQEFLSRGFVSEGEIKFDLRLEKDIIDAISNILENNPIEYKLLKDLASQCDKEVSKFLKIQNVISYVFEKRRIYEDDFFLAEKRAVFQLLIKNNIIKKVYDKNKESVFFWLDKGFFKTFMIIEKRVKFSPRYYLDKILCEEQPKEKEVIEYDRNLETLERWIYTNPQYKEELNQISEQITNIELPLMEQIERNQFEIREADVEVMDKLLVYTLKFIYKLSGDPYIINDTQEIFDIFRYTWLDNQELIYYLNARQNFKGKIISDKTQNKIFLKVYKDAYDTQILKIGRYINYNNILIVGSNELTDNEKRILNQARVIYAESLYKKSIEKYFDLIEEKCRQWLFNILELIFNSEWKDFLPQQSKNEITKHKSSDLKKFGTYIPNNNELYYLSRGSYGTIFMHNRLWNIYFSTILGTGNKGIISKLTQISQIAHKVKHNQKDEDLKKFAPNIKEGLESTHNILKILNRGYINLLNPDNILIQDSKIYMCWSSKVDLNIVSPFEINQIKVQEISQIIKEHSRKEMPVRGNYIDIGDRPTIQLDFTCSYREFIACLCYLIKTDKIKILDYEGTCLLFEFK
ncbi:MAG: hypothetical protein ACFFA7_17355 [Promethearchaeota archaeon]